MDIRRSPLEHYARSGYRQIEGWLEPLAVELLLPILETQRAAQLGGAVCEIGVHHGRLFILLCLAAAEAEQAVAYDLFHRQNENVDRSGRGDLDIFLANVRRHGCNRARVKAVVANSMELDGASIIADCGCRPRLFSIDGGHTAEMTFHDLSAACDSLCRGGVIILDDFFNECWPGVAEGASRFILMKPHALIPVAIGGNKLLLTNDSVWAEKYKASLLPLQRRYSTKHALVFGHEAFVIWGKRRSFAVRLAAYVGRLLRRLPWPDRRDPDA